MIDPAGRIKALETRVRLVRADHESMDHRLQRVGIRHAILLVYLTILALAFLAITVLLVHRDKTLDDRITKQEILLQDAVAAQQAYQDRVLEVLRDQGMIEALPSGSTSGTPISD